MACLSLQCLPTSSGAHQSTPFLSTPASPHSISDLVFPLALLLTSFFSPTRNIPRADVSSPSTLSSLTLDSSWDNQRQKPHSLYLQVCVFPCFLLQILIFLHFLALSDGPKSPWTFSVHQSCPPCFRCLFMIPNLEPTPHAKPPLS